MPPGFVLVWFVVEDRMLSGHDMPIPRSGCRAPAPVVAPAAANLNEDVGSAAIEHQLPMIELVLQFCRRVVSWRFDARPSGIVWSSRIVLESQRFIAVRQQDRSNSAVWSV
jgi:hypothetical protein